jgi:hypothetical protein
MSAKGIVTRAMILAVLGGWTARAVAQQSSAPGPEVLPAPTAPATTPLPAVMPPPSQIPAAQAGLPPGSVPDPWITYARPDCCGPLGRDGPIDSEVYLRTGPSILTGNSILQSGTNTGWLVEFGGRSLFFNRDTTRAWTLDVGLDFNAYNGGGDHRFTLIQPFNTTIINSVFQATTAVVQVPLDVSIRDYYRESLRFSGGWEWYPAKPAYCAGWNWRIGTDVGGRYGWSRVDLNNYTNRPFVNFFHQSDVYGAVVLSLHSDLEVPVGPRTWLIFGSRAEWAYNWSDVLKHAFPPQQSNTGEVNLLMDFGVRF